MEKIYAEEYREMGEGASGKRGMKASEEAYRRPEIDGVEGR
jgi:hypothetical protein